MTASKPRPQPERAPLYCRRPAPMADLDALCSFCDRSATHVEVMIAGPYPVAICSDCVGYAVEIVVEYRGEAVEGAEGRTCNDSGAGGKG